MSDEYKAKLRSVGFSTRQGTSKRKPVIDDRDGSIGGYETEHWNGSQDAEVVLKPVVKRMKTEED